jgi:glycosyltransferase involved in cell wall biosynthesis
MHEIPIQRRINPLANLKSLFDLYRLINQYNFDVVNTHSPVAAAVGRAAAWLANVNVIAYTVHGFYFHDNMALWKKRGYIAIEWLLGRLTTCFTFVSDEDRRSAIRAGIVKSSAAAATIYNGIDLDVFTPRQRTSTDELRKRLEIPDSVKIVGIVGRVVREKGYLEFAEMARTLSARRDDVMFLVVGDALNSDRDSVVDSFRDAIHEAGIAGRFRFTGFTDQVAEHLQLMDVFVLPSYREGFPRSVLEAMGTALPVVATNIRGCREAVIDGTTGILVPPGNARALTEAVEALLKDLKTAIEMGKAGRIRAEEFFSQELVQERFVGTIAAQIASQSRL